NARARETWDLRPVTMAAVPLGFALFLLQLAVGGVLVTVALDWDGEVSTGFLCLNCAFLVAFAAAALWLRIALPAERLLSYPADTPRLLGETRWWVLFPALAIGQLVLLRLSSRFGARVVGVLAGGAGVGALVASAAAYQPPTGSVVPLLATL